MEKTGVITILFLVAFASSAKGSSSLLRKTRTAREVKDVNPDTRIHTCLGQNVTFPADLLPSAEPTPDVTIVSVEWLKNDGNNENLLAVNTSGHFLPLPGIKRALQAVPRQGVVMPIVQEADLGHYTVRVRSVQQNVLHVHTHQVTVDQEEDIPLDKDKLQAYITDDIIYDQSTNEWHVQVRCGRFLSDDGNSVAVTWKTPSNQLLNSTRSDQGNFVLHVPNPVEHGLYSCFLHTTHCLNKRQASGRAGEVFVNGVEQRLRVVETSLSALHSQCSRGQCGNFTTRPTQDNTDSTQQPTSASDQEVNVEGVVRDGDYVLAFRLTPRIGQSAYDSYVNVGHNDDDPLVRSAMPPGCLSVDGSEFCDRHYRSKVLDLWDGLHVESARVSLYVNKSEVVFFEFSAVGSDYINWFSKETLRASSYSDVLSEPKNFCSIQGPATYRRFYINRNYGGCPNDAGWLLVSESTDACHRSFGPNPPYPVVGYVHGPTYQVWSKKSAVRYADVMAIWVKMTPKDRRE